MRPLKSFEAGKAGCVWQSPEHIVSMGVPKHNHRETAVSALGLVNWLILPDALHFDAFIWLFIILISQGRERNRKTQRTEGLRWVWARISAWPQGCVFLRERFWKLTFCYIFSSNNTSWREREMEKGMVKKKKTQDSLSQKNLGDIFALQPPSPDAIFWSNICWILGATL